MYYKLLDNKICCTKSDDGSVIQYAPWSHDVINDDALEWKHTDKSIIRLPDFSFVFIDDLRVLESEKLQKLGELENSFDACVSGAFTCSQGWPMQFNRSDTLAVEGAIQLLKSQNEHAGYLTDANDETHYGVPLETMEAVKLEMLQAYARCHAHKQELRKIINSAQSKEELAEITISWPV